MSGLERKSLEQPDEGRDVPLGRIELTQVGLHTFGRGVMRPGWRWSTHMRPVMGTPSCPIHHVQLLLSGQFAVRMDDGEELLMQPGDLMNIPPGHDAWVVGDEPAVLIDIAGNIDALGLPQEHERIVTTLLLTDIVDSTKTAERLGDAAWKQLLAEHNRIVRVQAERHRGVEVNYTGDGFLLMFMSTVGALRCAVGVRDGVREAGLEVRIGVHTGEVERTGDQISGINIHTTARIASLAGASQIYVSSATRGLADGGGFAFRDAGLHEVKGVGRPVEVAALVG